MEFSRFGNGLVLILQRRSTVSAVEIGLLVLLAYLAASLFWTLSAAPSGFESAGPFGAAQPMDRRAGPPRGVLVEYDPFHRGDLGSDSRQAALIAPPETVLDVKLFGIRLAGGEGGGSAIIRLQNYRHAVLEKGDEVSPGVTLSEIHPGYVILSRDGRRETLYLDPDVEQRQDKQPDRAATVADASAGQTDGAPQALFHDVGFRTMRDESGQISGIVVSAGEGSDFYERTELEIGDVVVAVNGVPVADFGPLAELRQSLQGASSVSLVVERKGQRQSIQLGMP